MERQPQADGVEGPDASGAGPGAIHEDGTYERTGDLIASGPVQGQPGADPTPAAHGTGCGLIFIGGALLLLALFVVKCTGEF